MLFTGWEVRAGKIFCRGLKNGPRPKVVLYIVFINFWMMQVIISINKYEISPILAIYEFLRKNEGKRVGRYP